MLERMHETTDIPKSRIVERAIRTVEGEYADIPKAMGLLRAIEEAEADFAEGRAKPLEEVRSEIEKKRTRRRHAA